LLCGIVLDSCGRDAGVAAEIVAAAANWRWRFCCGLEIVFCFVLSYLSEILKWRMLLLEILGLVAGRQAEMRLGAARSIAALTFSSKKSSFICD
jgi:hypothetical protein